jgi:hypothetical protein
MKDPDPQDDRVRFGEKLHALVTAERGAVAAKAFERYFATDGRGFTGSQFEFVTDWDTPNAITARDIVAVFDAECEHSA